MYWTIANSSCTTILECAFLVGWLLYGRFLLHRSRLNLINFARKKPTTQANFMNQNQSEYCVCMMVCGQLLNRPSTYRVLRKYVGNLGRPWSGRPKSNLKRTIDRGGWLLYVDFRNPYAEGVSERPTLAPDFRPRLLAQLIDGEVQLCIIASRTARTLYCWTEDWHHLITHKHTEFHRAHWSRFSAKNAFKCIAKLHFELRTTIWFHFSIDDVQFSATINCRRYWTENIFLNI